MTFRPLAFALVALAVLWVMFHLATFAAIEQFTDSWTASMAASPYNHAHLIEEAHEGAYSPLSHGLFLLNVLFSTCVPFGLVTYLLARQIPSKALAIVPSLLATLLLSMQFRYIWASDFPGSMRLAFLIEISSALAASLLAIFAAAAQKTRKLARKLVHGN